MTLACLFCLRPRKQKKPKANNSVLAEMPAFCISFCSLLGLPDCFSICMPVASRGIRCESIIFYARTCLLSKGIRQYGN